MAILYTVDSRTVDEDEFKERISDTGYYELPQGELTPFFISQSLKDAKTTLSTLREELPKRMKGPITVTTEILGVKSTRTYKPFDPRYNLE